MAPDLEMGKDIAPGWLACHSAKTCAIGHYRHTVMSGKKKEKEKEKRQQK